MATLADIIEAYIRQRLVQAHEGFLEVRRCDLAGEFSCAPSQINYVLETRFTPERGYIVESRRGGGGFIRITSSLEQPDSHVYTAVYEVVGDEISLRAAEDLLQRLYDAGFIELNRVAQVRRFLRRETARLRPPWGDRLRSGILRGMLLLLLEKPNE